MTWIYKRWAKFALILFQMAAVGVLAGCLMNVGFWTDGNYSLREMSRSYEEADLFFRQIDTIVAHKIRGQQNDELFAPAGQTDLSRSVDIQSYGMAGSSVQDLNTTYYLRDLIRFAEDGDREALHEAIEDALEHQGERGQEAGERLDESSGRLETILPVTGISLSECSRWYSDSSDFILNMYTRLDEVSREIYERYTEYTTVQEESWSKDAPSNLRYCIENTSTGKLYTNADAGSYEEALEKIAADGRFSSLYEGERSFNIMVTNPDNLMNQEAADWFMEERFVGTNERVYFAVDTAYPVGDELGGFAEIFAHREDSVRVSLVGTIICGVLLLAGFVLSMLGAGKDGPKAEPGLLRMDDIPTELSLGLYVILAVLYVFIYYRIAGRVERLTRMEQILVLLAAVSGYLAFLSAALSAARRIRAHVLWKNSVVFLLVRTWRKVTAARAASGQLLFFYVIFFILNFTFLLFGKLGILLVFVLDMAVLLFLLRDMAGKQSVYDGIHQISKGDLQYKIDTAALQGETYEMAKAVNEMGDGLQKAVDAIVRNERLKAELITNVSHDIKTPLTSIVSYVDLLKRENLQDHRVRHYIEVLDQKSQRLKQLTEDLVEASKISSGNVELEMVKMQLQSMMQQAYGEFQERFEERGLSPVWNMEREPACIMADGRQLWRILENLLGNIYKYAADGTRIYIDLYHVGKRICLSLQNTSRETLTMDAQELAGRFVRGDRSRSTEGSGLGLSIAQNLVELQGGSFQIDVEGDLFRVTLGFPEAEDSGA